MTKEEAIKIATEYLKKHDVSVVYPQPEAVLITKETLESSDLAVDLRKARPAAWKLLLAKHRDYWSVRFDMGPQKARDLRFCVVDVYNDTGEIIILEAL